MTDTTYNGWRNRATWCVALWLSEMNYSAYFRERHEDWAEENYTREQVYTEIMDEIEGMVGEMFDECYSAAESTSYGPFAADLLVNKPDWLNIDYRAIAEEYVDDYFDFRSESLRGSAKAAYGKTKVVTQKGVQKAKAGASKAKTRVAPKKAPAKSASNRAKAPAKKPATRRR